MEHHSSDEASSIAESSYHKGGATTNDATTEHQDDCDDDGSTIVTTFTCLQHQYQQQTRVRLENIHKVKKHLEEDEQTFQTESWEDMEKEDLIKLLRRLRGDTERSIQLNHTGEEQADYSVQVPPWAKQQSASKEEEEDKEAQNITTNTSPNQEDQFDVQLPPWFQQQKKKSQAPTFIEEEPEEEPEDMKPDPANKLQVKLEEPPKKKPQPQQELTISDVPNLQAPLPPLKEEGEEPNTAITETITETAPKPPSLRNLFTRRRSSPATNTETKVPIPAVPKNIQSLLHCGPKTKEGVFLTDSLSSSSIRLDQINASWNEHYSTDTTCTPKKKQNYRRRSNQQMPVENDSDCDESTQSLSSRTNFSEC